MAKLKVRIRSVVEQFVTVNNADQDDEEMLIDDARSDAEFKLEEHEFVVLVSDIRIQWEGEE
jgi:hypothetical protein